jgi:hypothetical protein
MFFKRRYIVKYSHRELRVLVTCRLLTSGFCAADDSGNWLRFSSVVICDRSEFSSMLALTSSS